jgi:glycerol uptake facilitator protein
MSLGTVFVSELAGTAILLLFGCGVVANVALNKTKGLNGGFLLVNFGWAIGVFAGVYVAYRSGGHINPAVTLGLLASGADEYAPGVDATFASTLVYLSAQFLGAFLGGVLTWASYKKHFDDTTEPEPLIGVFSTGPAIRNTPWNTVTEVIGTFVLVFVILTFGQTPSGLGPLAAALLVLGIGNSLGGPTGYAINPARDLGPRVAHAVLPIPNKGSSDWSYSWIPVVGPVIGGVLAGLVGNAFVS